MDWEVGRKGKFGKEGIEKVKGKPEHGKEVEGWRQVERGGEVIGEKTDMKGVGKDGKSPCSIPSAVVMVVQ